jgi:hypothetical protein
MDGVQRPWWKKLLWLIVIWAFSVAALALVAYGMKLLMRSAGLSG